MNLRDLRNLSKLEPVGVPERNPVFTGIAYGLAICVVFWTIVFALLFHWYNKPAYVEVNNCVIEDIVDNPDDVIKATNKMGPMRNYIIEPNGTLRVKVDGEWLKLKY
jgi:hypothetical protein